MDIRTFSNGKRVCVTHNSTSCDCITNTPSFPMETKKSSKVKYNKVHGKITVNHGKSRLVSRNRIYERFHSYRLKFVADVDFVNLEGTVHNLNNNVKFKRLEFPEAIVQVFRASILIILRSNQEIKGLSVKEAKSKSDILIKNVLSKLPKEIKVKDSKLVEVHNAFVNHPFAKRKVEVSINGEKRFISDNSKGSPEFEAIHPSFAISDSEYIESDIISLVDKGLSREFFASAINSLIEDRRYWAKHQISHVEAIQTLGSNVSNLGSGINELTSLVKRLNRKEKFLRRRLELRGVSNDVKM